MASKIMPREWRNFQHYKDRMPPWIRLHKALLDDYHYQCLPIASKALAPMLWLIASESKNITTGEFEYCVTKMAFRLRMTEKEIEAGLKPLIKEGFFVLVQDASTLIADCQQVAVPETETETETDASKTVLPDWLPLENFKDFKTHRAKMKAAMTPKAELLFITELTKLKDMGHDPIQCIDTAILNNWKTVYAPKGNSFTPTIVKNQYTDS